MIKIHTVKEEILRFNIIREESLALETVGEDRIIVDIDQALELMMEWFVWIIEAIVNRILTIKIVVFNNIVSIKHRTTVRINFSFGLGTIHMRLAKRLHGDGL